MSYEEIINFIKRIKKERKLTLDDLAELAYCYNRTIAAYLRLERKMPADVLITLLTNLGYSITLDKELRK